MITERLKQLTAAIDAFHQTAHDMQPGHNRDVALNVLHYIKQDMRLLYHEFGYPKAGELD